MRIQSFALVPDLGVTRFVCTYCARSLGRADIVDTPLFADGWFGGEPQFEAQRARARVPGCLDCATELARLQERLQAAYDDGAATTPLDVQRWMDRLVRALHRVELRALLPRHARIDGGVVSDHHDVARLDSELEFEYRLPAPGLAYWFASPIERGGGSIWFVSIRRRVLLSAVVPAL